MAKKVLIVQTAFAGDLLLTIPLIKRVRKSKPEAEIYLYCRKGLGEFFLMNQLVHKVLEVDKENRNSERNSQVIDELKTIDFSVILCPHQSMTSAKLVSILKAPVKIGYKKFWNFFAFTQRIERPNHLPEVLRQLIMWEPYDEELKAHMREFHQPHSPASERINSVNQGRSIPEWASMGLPPFSRIEMEKRIEKDSAFRHSMEKVFQLAQQTKIFEKETVFLAPGSVWPTKRWPAENYIDLGRSLRRRGYNVGVVGAPDEAEICQKLAGEISGAVDFCGQTSLFETFLLFQKGKALISNDSGAMHLAAVAQLPAVAIFGPTTLALGYRPWQTNSRVVQIDLACRPCGKHGGEKCPLKTHQCMKDINELMVLEAFDNLFNQ